MGRPRWPPSPLQSHADPIPSARRSGPVTPSHPSLHTRVPKWRASPGEMLGEQGATGASSLQLLLTPCGQVLRARWLPALAPRGQCGQRGWQPAASITHAASSPLSPDAAAVHAPPPGPSSGGAHGTSSSTRGLPATTGSGQQAVGPGTSARSSGLPLVRGQCLAGRFTWWL